MRISLNRLCARCPCVRGGAAAVSAVTRQELNTHGKHGYWKPGPLQNKQKHE